MNVNQSLLKFLDAEDGVQEEPPKAEAEGTEESQTEDQPESETSGEAEAQVETEEAPEADAPRIWKVKVDGEEVEVPEDELIHGYSRQQDYTRKTMKLAEERKALDAKAEQTRVLEAQYAERLEGMKALLDRQMGPEPDWDAVKATDPAGYAVQYADFQRQQAARGKVEAEQVRVRQRQVEEQQVQFQARIVQERERLLESLPEWKNSDTARKEQETLMTYGASLGFTEDELGNLYDHRAVLILDKARKWDEAQKKGKKVLTQKAAITPVLKPGTSQPPKPKSTAKDVARDRFAKSGRPQDAAAFLEHLLADGQL
jgi:hypothetical protein